jgi:hypothetical protein
MLAKTHEDIRKIYDSIDAVKRLSDRIIGIGPINIIGLDGILSWIPGVGVAYSVIASLIILWQGIRARSSLGTLFLSTQILIANDVPEAFVTKLEIIPGVSEILAAVNTLLQGHLYAAHLIQTEMKKTHYVEGSASEAHRSGSYQTDLADMRATKGKKRLVYLG